MGLIGNEIIQSRVWIDPNAPDKTPKLNYKYTFPITVFDAVRESMTDEGSQTLREALDYIYEELRKRQTIVPDIPTDFLMTYAGKVGEIGSIEISHRIPWDAALQTHSRIPTEKAVGELLQKVGLVDSSGEPIDPESQKIQWSNIIGRPNIYHEFGPNDDGFITQDVVSAAIESIQNQLAKFTATTDDITNELRESLGLHVNRTDNPHQVTAEQVGAPSLEVFEEHINADNPHGITAETIGLEKVDNTSDEDKPLSKATREALAALQQLITDVANNAGKDTNCIIDVSYNRFSGKFVARFKDGSELVLDIPINGLVDDIRYDTTRRMLVIYELSGERRELDLTNLIYKCIGSKGTAIEVTIEDVPGKTEQIVKAQILPHSITPEMLSPDVVLGGGDFVIEDASILTRHLRDGSVTTEKIRDRSITGDKIVPQAVDGKALFRATEDNQVLITRKANSDPVWGPIIADLIVDHAIKERHITDWAVTTPKIADGAVTEPKIADRAVTNDKIQDSTISGGKLVWNPKLPGTPTNTVSPDKDAAGHELIDASWLRDFILNYVFSHHNIGRRTVDGENIVPSENGFEVFATLEPNTDPEWQKITRDFLVEKVIGSEQIDDSAVHSEHVAEGAIGPRELFTSERGNRILAVLTDGGHPEYTKLVRSMLDENIIGTKQIEDRAVTLDKIIGADEDYRVLVTRLKGSIPEWTLVNGKMIAERSISAKHIFSTPAGSSVLIVDHPDQDPQWGKVKGSMIEPEAIGSEHLKPGIIRAEHMSDDAIDGGKIVDRSIPREKIDYRSIGGEELFTSPFANRVLAVKDLPYEDPQWVQVIGKMIEDGTITPDKLESSADGYKVLGVRNPNETPEYLRIGSQFLEDGAVTSKKVEKDIVLPGTPELTVAPDLSANNDQLASTAWVRQYIEQRMKAECWECEEFEQMTEESVLDIWDGTRTDIPDEQDGPFKGLTEAQIKAIWDSDENPEDIPPADPCECGDMYEIGLDDVLDSWNAASVDSSFGSRRFITGKELFSSNEPGVLAVTEPNEDAKWTKVQTELIEDKAVTSDKLAADLELSGRPKLTERPPDSASDVSGAGSLIPDCQWVLDRIQDALNEFTSSGGSIGDGCWSEIVRKVIMKEWRRGGEGSTDADSGELTFEQITAEWFAGGSGDITSEEGEITNDVVRDLWARAGLSRANGEIKGKAVRGIWENPDTFLDGVSESDYELGLARIQEIWNNPMFSDEHDHCLPGEISSIFIRELWKNPKVSLKHIAHKFGGITPDAIRDMWSDPDLFADVPPLPHELEAAIIKSIWENPNEPKDIGEWFELAREKVIWEYNKSGKGSTDADAGELGADDVRKIWSELGIGNTKSDPGEIGKPDIWTAWISALEHDHHPYNEEHRKPRHKDPQIIHCDGCGNSGPATALSGSGIVKNEHIANGAVNGEKLFTSLTPDTVLAVLSSAGIPEYTKINRNMLLDRIIGGRQLMTSDEDQVILSIKKSGGDAEWTKITRDLLPNGIIGSEQIENGSLTTEKFKPASLDFSVIDLTTVNIDTLLKPNSVHEIHIRDQAVTTPKIADGAVDDTKIAEHTISGSKIRRDTVIPAYTTVESHTEYEKRSIRNTIISPNAPKNARNGDIWFRYY